MRLNEMALWEEEARRADEERRADELELSLPRCVTTEEEYQLALESNVVIRRSRNGTI
jgi:hypothetical protein